MLRNVKKRVHITRTIGNSGWDQLVDRMLSISDGFQAVIEQIPAGVDKVKLPGKMAIRDMVAHVADMNYAVGTIIDSLYDGRRVSFKIEDLYRGARKKAWQEVIEDHRGSREHLADAVCDPISSLKLAPNHVYGPLNAREWMAYVIDHYTYHLKQLEAILNSSQYKAEVARSRAGAPE